MSTNACKERPWILTTGPRGTIGTINDRRKIATAKTNVSKPGRSIGGLAIWPM